MVTYLLFYLQSYHIKDVEFKGEVCGPATIREFLKLPDVPDADLYELTSKLCMLPRDELRAIAGVIIPELDVGGLVKNVCSFFPSQF